MSSALMGFLERAHSVGHSSNLRMYWSSTLLGLGLSSSDHLEVSSLELKFIHRDLTPQIYGWVSNSSHSPSINSSSVTNCDYYPLGPTSRERIREISGFS
ncbi:hypothetical protein ABFS83_05G085500 [Erythranthe nasuta]